MYVVDRRLLVAGFSLLHQVSLVKGVDLVPQVAFGLNVRSYHEFSQAPNKGDDTTVVKWTTIS
jgi:hypothetical protein